MKKLFLVYLINFNFLVFGLIGYVAADERLQSGQVTSESDPTESLIGYLGDLLEHRIIGDAELERLMTGIAQAPSKLVNPISHEMTEYGPIFTNAIDQIHYEGVQEYLEDAQHSSIRGEEINLAQVFAWAEKSHTDLGRVRNNREEAKKETQIPFRKMTFHRVEPGKFMMEFGGPHDTGSVELTRPFEMMSTEVTQWQWSAVMEANPSKHVNDGIELLIGGKSVQIQPDHPVEHVKWNFVQEYIGKLNQLSESNDPLIYRLIIDHRKGYRYRLPTEAEWEFVLKNRGRENRKFYYLNYYNTNASNYYFGMRGEHLEKYAWFRENSGDVTHAVGELEPILVDGNAFYDMFGNVSEMMQDPYHPVLSAGVDPVFSGQSDFMRIIIRGRSYAASKIEWVDGFGLDRQYMDPNLRGGIIGFRLVRTVPADPDPSTFLEQVSEIYEKVISIIFNKF